MQGTDAGTGSVLAATGPEVRHPDSLVTRERLDEQVVDLQQNPAAEVGNGGSGL